MKLILMIVNLIHARMVENALMLSTNTPVTEQVTDSLMILMCVEWLHVSTTETSPMTTDDSVRTAIKEKIGPKMFKSLKLFPVKMNLCAISVQTQLVPTFCGDKASEWRFLDMKKLQDTCATIQVDFEQTIVNKTLMNMNLIPA